MSRFSGWFLTFSRYVEKWAGSPIAFVLAILTVTVWAATGPFFGWSDSHSLFINTLTTIITFVLAFLILSTQSRDTLALHTKLDELIRVGSARNELINIENATGDELSALKRDLAGESGVGR